MKHKQPEMLRKRFMPNHRLNLKRIMLLLVLVFPMVFPINNMYIKASASDLPVHNINTGMHYPTIQEAIDASQTTDGHTILVDDGTYYEHIIVYKTIRLLGTNQSTTIIDGNGTGQVVSLTANASEIAGFTVQNGEWGIDLTDVQNASVTENKVFNCSYGGIKVHECSTCTVANNTATSTTQAGIYLMESERNLITNNTIASTSHGIWLLSHSTNNIISNNFVINNPQGIVSSYNCDNSTLMGNTVASSSVGGIVMGGASNNTIFHNNLLQNNQQAWSYGDSSNSWDDGYPSGGNYWSDYGGVDLYKGPYQNVTGSDGIGDTPYAIDASNHDNYPLMNPWTAITNVASLVVRGQNNIIYYRTYNVTTDSWNDWNALPGATCDSPAAAVCGNELHMVVRGMDGNTLWHGYVNLIGGGFSGWTLLSGSTPSAPTLTANSTHLCLVVRGQNNLIYYRFYTFATRTWTDWAALPSGATCNGPAATMLANKLHVVVRGMDGYSLWHSNIDLSTGAFSGWELVGGATESKPTLATCEARDEVCLVVRGLNNVIYRNTWSGSAWAGWVGLPSGATCDGIGATVMGEALHVVVRGMDGYSLWHSSVDLGTGGFTGWTLLSGSTPDKPTLTS